ncbi:hypothetical protein KQX54_016456 [Cotesia glomerata]|uniref:Uncharacterized protein n=1 Tax=Cotesia glomerata TaxID=32391 RepID=A0AAV7HZF2_COTGL|nr:hypothetical protein KQX54_016456 [Cotesia glomerata]
MPERSRMSPINDSKVHSLCQDFQFLISPRARTRGVLVVVYVLLGLGLGVGFLVPIPTRLQSKGSSVDKAARGTPSSGRQRTRTCLASSNITV